MITTRLATCLLAAACSLPALRAPAQEPRRVPLTLLGRWQARHVGVKTPPALLPAARRYLNVGRLLDLNEAVQLGQAHLTVDFRPDSTYTFTITRGGRSFRTETGTFTMRRGRLLASAPDSPDGSSFNNQLLLRLKRRLLVLVFPVNPELPGVNEEVTYYRVGPVPSRE